MKKYTLPHGATLSQVVDSLNRAIPEIQRELERLDKACSAEGPTLNQILCAVKESGEVKDAIYRYIKDREEREA